MGIAAVFFAGAADGQSPFQSPTKQYASCLALAREDPEAGFRQARTWETSGGGTGARHCAAVALLGKGDHPGAATAFEQLGREMTGQSKQVRAELFAQAGQAWQAAGQPKKALAPQNAAIWIDPDNAEIWVDRSVTFAGLGAWREASEDLGRALQLAPGRADILTVRAAAWRNLAQPSRALADAEQALRLAPGSPDATLERGLARRALGDGAGAETDFRRVLRLTRGAVDIAERARAGLGDGAMEPRPGAIPAGRPLAQAGR